MNLRATLIIPVAYVFIEFVLLASCFLSLGHWGGCTFSYYLMFPGAFIAPRIYLIGMFLAIGLNILGYASIGYLVDRLRAERPNT